MITLHLYKLKPNGWLTTTPELAHKAPSDAELVFVSSAESQAEARDKVDRFLDKPPFLSVQHLFREALESGLTPCEAVRKVHKEIGVLNSGEWPDHFNEVLGIDSYEVSLLFIEWWPDHTSGMSDDNFNDRIAALKNA